MADTPKGETGSEGIDSNKVLTPSNPSGDNANEVAQAETKKELEQLKMRNNQLANQLEETRKADEARKAKELEQKEEFKSLYEQTQSKLSELESSQKAEEQRRALSKATEELFKDYDSTVVDLAKTAGLSLTDNTDEGKAALKEKLETFKSKVTPSNRITPNNPGSQVAINPDRAALTARGSDGSSPMAMAAAKGDDSVTLQYIKTLPAIARMKEMAQQGN